MTQHLGLLSTLPYSSRLVVRGIKPKVDILAHLQQADSARDQTERLVPEHYLKQSRVVVL